MKKKLCGMTAIVAILCLSMFVYAETEVIRITDNEYIDMLPAVNDNYLCWQGYQNGDWEIFLYDIAAAHTIQVTDNGYDDISAQTDGNYVVWLGMNNTGGNIFLYDINSGQITRVTDNNAIKSPPQIADGLVVWAAQQVTESVLPGEIKLYEIATRTTTILSTSFDPEGNLDDHTPLIRDNKVVWVQTGPDGTETTRFIYDLTSGDTYPAPADFTMGTYPTRDGDLTITTRFDGHDREIFLNYHCLKRNEQVTDNNVEEQQPRIHGNHLVWVSGQGMAQEIYLGITRHIAAISPGDGQIFHERTLPVFTWQGIGYDRFKVQFSSVKNFKRNRTYTFPRQGNLWLYGNSFTANKREARQINRLMRRNRILYWRVQARDEYGNETTSHTRSFIAGY